MRVRPTGLSAPPVVKRYQYHRSGSSPSTSTWTECAHSAVAVSVPFFTICRMRSSDAISQLTGTGAGSRPPPLMGSSASRVHNTTPVGVGSPEATPSVNGDAVHRGEMSAAPRARSFAYGIAQSVALDTSSDRREIERLNQASKRESTGGRCGMMSPNYRL